MSAQQLAERPDAPAPPVPIVRRDAESLMGAIISVASDPSVDVAKLQQLEELHKRILDRQARAAFDAALADMQPELPSIAQNGKITIAEKNNPGRVIQATPYALFNDINEAIKPTLQKHGFAVRFQTDTTAEGKIVVTCILSHRDGHREQTASPPLMHDSTGSKNSVQAIGSSVSYGKRYTLMAALNLTSHVKEDADDDGARGGGPALVNDEQVETLQRMIVEADADLPRFLSFLNIDKLAELPASRFDQARVALEGKRRRA